ncbi:F-box protein CPR1-like [Impatiens glandulifera]|uniref:F-box protein CPR1-like n=1 Tax=Impatiens glandulifera TaxID=253017 RepID=UPI001FB1764E|nr:F-box protein CPR1-like [Impatiens glandulifera]
MELRSTIKSFFFFLRRKKVQKLPDEILELILSRLPVKCLLNLRCVSKSWLTLISRPKFVKLHLKQSVQTKINLSLYLSCINRPSSFYRVDFDSLEKNDGYLQPVEVNYNPLSHLDNRTNIYGSCDGLICISNSMDIVLLWNSSTRRFLDRPSSAMVEFARNSNLSQYISSGFGFDNQSYNPLRRQDNGTGLERFSEGLVCMTYTLDIVVLWNPSTRKSIKLPQVSVEIPNQSYRHKYSTYGIGYDETNHDYKVVRVVVVLGDDIYYEVHVFSLRLNLWHKPKKYSDHHPDLESLKIVMAGGAMHWMSVGMDNKRSILAFDLGTETYRVIQHPEYRDLDFSSSLDNLGGCLSLTCHYHSGIVDVWVLKEYGGENESWSRLAQNIPITYTYVVKSVAYSKNGKKLLLRKHNSLVWYDLELKSLENIRFHAGENNYPFKFEVIDSCLESLVDVNVAEAG